MGLKGNSRAMEVPSLVLLGLVGQFLESNGFKSSHRIYNTERKKRPKKEGWLGTLGRNYIEGYPSLEEIFKHWAQQQTGEGPAGKLMSVTNDAQVESSGESSDSHTESSDESGEDVEAATEDSDVDMQSSDSGDEAPAATVEAPSNPLKRKAQDTTPSESEESSSGSDSDGESDSSSSAEAVRPAKKKKLATSSNDESESESDSESMSGSGSDSTSDTDTDSSSDSGTDSGSSSSSDESGDIGAAVSTALPSSGSSDTSSSEGSGDDDDDDDDEDNPNRTADGSKTVHVPNGVSASVSGSSDSSATVTGDVKTVELDRDSLVQLERAAPLEKVTLTGIKKKHIGAQPTRLATLSATANARDYISNSYVSYDYADRAYRDLVVTRGKGFTKEKNKKKRGSYRGGAIDISGGKSFKFEE